MRKILDFIENKIIGVDYTDVDPGEARTIRVNNSLFLISLLISFTFIPVLFIYQEIELVITFIGYNFFVFLTYLLIRKKRLTDARLLRSIVVNLTIVYLHNYFGAEKLFFLYHIPLAVFPLISWTSKEQYGRIIAVATPLLFLFIELFFLIEKSNLSGIGWFGLLNIFNSIIAVVSSFIYYWRLSEKYQYEMHEKTKSLMHTDKLTSIGMLSASIGHEVNNNMLILMGRINLLKNKIKSGKFDQEMMMADILKMETASQSILRIVRGLKIISRDGQSDPFTPVVLQTLIKDTLALHENQIKQAGIKMLVEVPNQPIVAYCRPSQIAQVILNLVNNSKDAILALPERRITVRLEREQNTIRLTIEDSGPGIPVNIRQRIFEPFYTTKQVGQGTGLGLGICRDIISSHHGKLYLDEAHPETRFICEWPAEPQLDQIKLAG